MRAAKNKERPCLGLHSSYLGVELGLVLRLGLGIGLGFRLGLRFVMH